MHSSWSLKLQLKSVNGFLTWISFWLVLFCRSSVLWCSMPSSQKVGSFYLPQKPPNSKNINIFLYIFIFYLGCFFLSVIIWIGSWTKTRCLYAVSFDLAGTFGHTLFNDFYKMNFKKNKTFCSWMVETFDRQVFRLTDSWCTKTTS